MEIQGKIADKMTFFYNFSANLVISVVKLVDAECRYHGKRGTGCNRPSIGLLFFLRSSRGQGIFSPVQVLPGINKEASW